MLRIQEFNIMKKWGQLAGREGMSRAAIQAVEEFDGTYKGAMVLAGRMKAIAQATSCDIYWSEKMNKGYQRQLHLAETSLVKNKSEDSQ